MEGYELFLMHYGMPRRSGRYPWGSGENPYQHSGDFLARVDKLKKEGMTEKEIADSLGVSTGELRNLKAIAKYERRSVEVATAKDLRDKGYSLAEIARRMGYNNESSVRSLLNEKAAGRMEEARKTADFLKKQIDEKGMIDVGAEVCREIGVTQVRMDQALKMLELEGYPVYGGSMAQVTNPGMRTVLKIACPPGTEHKDIYDTENIHSVIEYASKDGGDTFNKFTYPESMSSERLMVRYGDEGGSAKDGVIELRRGVPDLDLNGSHYAQVRILVDGNKYLKGMAIYSDDMPEGVDVVFNTNKQSGTPVEKVLKDIKENSDNPFGSYISPQGQSWYQAEDGSMKLSLINKRADEGEWGEWSKKLPSQFLAKQPMPLIEKQLGLSIADHEAEYAEICSLTNPVVKRHYLEAFADDCDTAAKHLYAAALPRQKYQVILPVESLKDNEIYAPNYENGEVVALVRYPHGGIFEIPVLTVNNRHEDAKKIVGPKALDAVGINPKVAEQLSGADFDGDTVMVIPCNSEKSNVNIMSRPRLPGLVGFDPKFEYGCDEIVKDSSGKEHYYRDGREFRPMRNTQNEMGRISNLITDMTLSGASYDELAKAVRHSMVVIDAEKHHLDYKQSEIDNDIQALKNRYQGRLGEDGKMRYGAATILSRAKNEETVEKRQGSPKINLEGKSWYDPERPEGALVYTKAEKATYIDKKTGKEVQRTQKSAKMDETDDAYTLVRDRSNPKETAYADYANRMKAMANRARVELAKTGRLEYDPQARKVYQEEVASLEKKLEDSLRNQPRERQAQMKANARIKAAIQEDPSLTKDKKLLKKLSQQYLTAAREQVGAKRTQINVTDREWAAIQSGAIHDNKLKEILRYADADSLRQKAMPKSSKTISQAKANKIKSMRTAGYTIQEIADSVGVSTSTVSEYMKGGNAA